MATQDDVTKLAALARLSIPAKDLPRFAQEFEGILAYVSQINELAIPERVQGAVPPLRNVFREDGEPTPPRTNTDTLVAAFPARKGDHLKVKKIISYE